MASRSLNLSSLLLQYAADLQRAASNVYIQPLAGQVLNTMPQHNPQMTVGGLYPGMPLLQTQFPLPNGSRIDMAWTNQALAAARSGDGHGQLIDLDNRQPPPNQCQPATLERVEGWLEQIPRAPLHHDAPRSLIDGGEGRITHSNRNRGGRRGRGRGRGGQDDDRAPPGNQNNGYRGRGRGRRRAPAESFSSEQAFQENPNPGQDEIQGSAQPELPDHQPQETKTSWYCFFDDSEISQVACAQNQSNSNEIHAGLPQRQHAGLEGCSDSGGGVVAAPFIEPEMKADKGKGRAKDKPDLDLSCFSDEIRHRIPDHRPFRILVRMLNSIKAALNLEYLRSIWLEARRNHLRYTFAKLIGLARPIALEQLGQMQALIVLLDAFTQWNAYTLHYEQLLTEMYVSVDSLLDAAPRSFEEALAVEDPVVAEWPLQHPPQWLLKDLKQEMRRIHHRYMDAEYGVTETFGDWRQSLQSFRELILQVAPEHVPLVDEAQRCQPQWNPYRAGQDENLPEMPVMIAITEHQDLDAVLVHSALDFEGGERKGAALPWS